MYKALPGGGGSRVACLNLKMWRVAVLSNWATLRVAVGSKIEGKSLVHVRIFVFP